MRDLADEHQGEPNRSDVSPAAGEQNEPSTPAGVVAVLIGPKGQDLASVAEFSPGAPVGYSSREFQEIRARRALAMKSVRVLSNDILSNAIDAFDAEKIMRVMCAQGCRVIIFPVGYDDE